MAINGNLKRVALIFDNKVIEIEDIGYYTFITKLEPEPGENDLIQMSLSASSMKIIPQKIWASPEYIGDAMKIISDEFGDVTA